MSGRTKRQEVQFKLGIVIESDGDELHAFCPALPGLHTSGRDRQEVLENAKDAAIAYLGSLLKHGDPIPIGCMVTVQPAQPPRAVEPLSFPVPLAAFA